MTSHFCFMCKKAWPDTDSHLEFSQFLSTMCAHQFEGTHLPDADVCRFCGLIEDDESL